MGQLQWDGIMVMKNRNAFTLMACLLGIMVGCSSSQTPPNNKSQTPSTSHQIGPVQWAICDDCLWIVVQCETWEQRTPMASPTRVISEKKHVAVEYHLKSGWNATVAETDVSLRPHMLTLSCQADELHATDINGRQMKWSSEGFTDDLSIEDASTETNTDPLPQESSDTSGEEVHSSAGSTSESGSVTELSTELIFQEHRIEIRCDNGASRVDIFDDDEKVFSISAEGECVRSESGDTN